MTNKTKFRFIFKSLHKLFTPAQIDEVWQVVKDMKVKNG
jgi:hypothetical protein